MNKCFFCFDIHNKLKKYSFPNLCIRRKEGEARRGYAKSQIGAAEEMGKPRLCVHYGLLNTDDLICYKSYA
jgi:hypothetical protein